MKYFVEHLSALLIMPKTLTPELEEQLTDLFYGDTLQGLANPKQLAEEAKANNIQITQAIAKEFITKQATAQRFTKIKKERLFVPITAPHWTYQIDTCGSLSPRWQGTQT